MSDQPPRSTTLSNLLMFAGITTMVLPLICAAFVVDIPLFLAGLIGAIPGGVLCLIGFRLHPNSTKQANGAFLPDREDVWGILAFAAFALVLLVPIGILNLIRLLPDSDDWSNVAVRLTCLIIAVGVSWGWIQLSRKMFAAYFRSRTTDDLIASFFPRRQTFEPVSAAQTAKSDWPLLLFAAIALAIGLASQRTEFRSPEAPPRTAGQNTMRGAGRVVQWSRTHPNTLFASTILLAMISFGLYGYRIWSASRQDESRTRIP